MMDTFSYCDISSVFITKTIDRIISPMAVQLCHLIISLECDGNKYTAISGDLEQLAQELSKFAEHFANTSLRIGVECGDRTLGQEMEKAARSLLITGKGILLSVQKLNIQPAVRKHQEELVISAQNILMGTLKILQLEDDAGVRKIHQAADWFLDCLTYLQKAENISQIQSHFWEFSEALLLLNSLTENRILDLKDSLHQKNLTQKLQILRKCVPMLFTATQSSIKHSYNDQIINSKLYIFDQTSKTVQELKQLLTSDLGRHDIKKQGSFAQELYNLLDILINPNPFELHNTDFDFLVGTVIFYCMYVADCSRPNIKRQLVKHCQILLEQRKRLYDHLTELQEGPCENQCDFVEQCAAMRVQLNHIYENLVSSLFYQILDAFTVKDPLKRLLSAALKANKKASLHSEQLFASNAFQPLVLSFEDHTEKLLKISSLVLAQCTQEQIIDEIQSSVDCLCRVRDEVVTLVLDTNKSYYECKMFEKAQSIYHKWIQATDNLIVSLDGILTVHQFLELSIREIGENKYHCEKLLRSQEPEIFQYHAADLCDLAERAGQVVTRYVDQSKSPIFRNGLRVLVRQLETSVLETRESMKKCVEKITCFTTQKDFLEKVNYLFESIHNVQEGITGSKHPDLLSPLRNEGGPLSNKLMTSDLHESEESKGDNEKKHWEQHETCLSYEGYLSKPVPFANTRKIIENSVNVENTLQIKDLQPLVDDLLSAIRKKNSKDIHLCGSLLQEFCSLYLEVANDRSLYKSNDETEGLICKDTEALILNLVQFKKNENKESALEMERFMKCATLLSFEVEKMKTYLISLVNSWYHFSIHLFCNSNNIKDTATNVEIFNKLMQCFARIVQSIREHLLDNYGDDLKFTDLSEKQEYVVKVQVKFSKCQTTANRLLTEVFCSQPQSENHSLEYICMFWAVSVLQLSKTLNEFMGIDKLSIIAPTDWIQFNISENKNLVILCETSLWLQEAAVLSIQNFKNEKEQKKVLLLKEEMGSLTEALLKLREDLIASPPEMSSTVDYMQLQMELIIKAELLMDHMKTLFKGKQTFIQGLYFNISSSSSSDNAFESVKSLVDRVTLVKKTLESSHCVTNKKELLLLVDHLYFLTNDIIARSRLFMENRHEWDLFMLEAMLLKWSAQAEQLISHVNSDKELEAYVLEFITQCLRSRERTETIMIEPDVLEDKASNVPIQSIHINVMEERSDTEYESKTSDPREQDRSNGDISGTFSKDIAPCGEINEYNKITSQSGLISKEQSDFNGTRRKKLSNRRKSTIRRSIRVVRSKKGTTTHDEDNMKFTEKPFNTPIVTLEKIIIREPEDSAPTVNIREKKGEDLPNQYHQVDSTGEECLVHQESPTLKSDVMVMKAKKEATSQQMKNLKTHTLFIAVKKRISHQDTVLHKTHNVLTAMQKQTLDQELVNEKMDTETVQGMSNDETGDHLRNRDERRMVQNVASHEEIDIMHRGAQNKTNSLSGSMSSPKNHINVENLVISKTPNQGTFSMCEYPQKSTQTRIQQDHKEGMTEIKKLRSTTVKAYMTPTLLKKEAIDKQKLTLNNQVENTKDKEPTINDTQNNQLRAETSEELRHDEGVQKIMHNNHPILHPGMNILKMDYRKPASVSKDNLSCTTVVVEHSKVNSTSVEDVQTIRWRSQGYAKCLLAEEVETWEV
ncbi:uncharacterized protein [Engystomops pustulosus]|uniref:uncharacterized protein isoform X2 n=1 Tax=Engystomops pustulosus TaxID=76066 RepID=UPI003AFB0AD7